MRVKQRAAHVGTLLHHAHRETTFYADCLNRPKFRTLCFHFVVPSSVFQNKEPTNNNKFRESSSVFFVINNKQLCNTWLLPMRVFQFGDDGGVEIVCFRSWACGRAVHHVQASLILETHPFWSQGCLAMTWGHVRPWVPASPRVP